MENYFFVNNHTLIPTPETELLVRSAIDIIHKKQQGKKDITILDIGTGCGNIAISVALRFKKCKIYGSDISPEAIKVAKMNVNEFKLEDRIELRTGDLFDPFKEKNFFKNVDLIITNPPYLPTDTVNKLPAEIRIHEPRIALDAGPFGIDFIKRFYEDSFDFLSKDGVIISEIGEGQEKLFKRIIKKTNGYEECNVEFVKDSVDIVRVVQLFN
jgi:release factor glutamine methyltransferase